MPTIVSFASGKGGVGKSTTVSNIGLLLARRGYSVVVIDLDVGGADMHVLLGELSPSVSLSDFLDHRVESLEQVALPISWCPNLRLIAGTGDTLRNTNPASQTKRKLERHIRKLEADVVLLDIGAGTNYHALDFFLWADVPVLISTPDPTAMLDLYKFVKLAATRQVVAALGSREPGSESLQVDNLRTLEQLMAAARLAGPQAEADAGAALARLQIALVLNQATPNDRAALGRLRGVIQRFLGSDAQVLGQVPSDPAVTLSVRRFLPVVEAAPQCPAARALSSVCDELQARLPAPTLRPSRASGRAQG